MARDVAEFATDARDVREIWPVAGVGGFLEIEWVTATGSTPTPQAKKVKIEVQQWSIDHEVHNVRLPLPSGKGAMSRRRVYDDFTFEAELVLDIKPTREKGPHRNAEQQPFIDGKFEGYPNAEAVFHFSLRLQCGDPDFYYNRESQPIPQATTANGLYYYCPRVILEKTITTCRQRSVLIGNVRGAGSAPLERHVNEQDTGIGALGFEVE